MELTELDLAVVSKIQELRNCTPDAARKTFRRGLQKLANQDVENRAELIWDALNRTAEPASDEEVEAAVDAKKPTRFERKQAAKKAKAEKQAAKKTAKPKSSTPKKARTRKPQEEPTPLTELTREVEVREDADSNFVQVKFKGAWATGYMLERDQKAAARFGPIHIADTKFSELKKAAKKNEQDAVVCIARRINGKVEQGYVVPVSLFSYLGDNNPYHRLEFTNEARKSHAEAGWDDCLFTVTKAAVEKAA